MAAINAKKSPNIRVFRSGIGAGIEKNDKPDVLDISTNRDNPLKEFPKKNFKLWIVKHPEGDDIVPGSETVVRSQHYGQAVDDFIIDWDKRKRLNRTIGYPVVQGKEI